MVEDLKNLHSLWEIVSCPLGLQNESRAFATKEGTIKVDEHLILGNVLYVWGLACNLFPYHNYMTLQNTSPLC